MRDKVSFVLVWMAEWEQEKIPKYRTEKILLRGHPETRKIAIKEEIYILDEVKTSGETKVKLRRKLIWSTTYIVAKYWKKNVG